MKNVRLNNGVMMPAIGFGVFQIPENETERAVNDAIEIGYRKFDTAAAYFNEEQLGNAIRQSGIKREEFFITTKLWVQDYEYDDALRAFDLSKKKLGLDYLDLYLMHKPYGNYYAAWRAMERLYKKGRIRAIGVTSFSNERLQDLFLHNEIKPVVNQLETHPFFQQQAANAFLRQEGIQHEAWAPFAEGPITAIWRVASSSLKLSKMPCTNGSSGPTTIMPIFCSRAKVLSAGKSVALIFTFSPTVSVPALPGAMYSFSTFGL